LELRAKLKIAKDEAQPDLIEGFVRPPLAATLGHIMEHSGGRDS
jgi:hypothetical protein